MTLSRSAQLSRCNRVGAPPGRISECQLMMLGGQRRTYVRFSTMTMLSKGGLRRHIEELVQESVLAKYNSCRARVIAAGTDMDCYFGRLIDPGSERGTHLVQYRWDFGVKWR